MSEQSVAQFRTALSSCRSSFLMAAGFSALINLLLLAPTLYLMQIYDRVLTSGNEATLTVLTALAVLLQAVASALETIRARILLRVSGFLDHRLGAAVLRARFTAALHRLSGGGRTIADFDTLRHFLSSPILFAFFDVPWSPVMVAVVFMIHPVLGTITAVGVTLLLALTWINEKATRRAIEEAHRMALSLTGAIESAARNAEVAASMGMLGNLAARWGERRARTLALQAVAGDRSAALAALGRFTRLVLQTTLLCTAAYLTLHDQISAGAIAATSLLVGRALAPIEQAIAAWRQVAAARICYVRLNDLLQGLPDEDRRTALPHPEGNLVVEGLAVVPPGSTVPVLARVSFTVAPGQLLAIIGHSGAGKSTLARALVGAWPSAAGAVRLDGAELAHWDREDLGRHIGYLPQDVELLDGTIAENISRFADGPDEDIVAAAMRANVHEMILRLPNGYQTSVGHGACALSGGQRQRIGLARALYGRPQLIVLDEPNANLDEEGDAALLAAIAQLKDEGATVVVVSHRPNLLELADRVLVLQEGTARMFGPKMEVLSRLPSPDPRRPRIERQPA